MDFFINKGLKVIRAEGAFHIEPSKLIQKHKVMQERLRTPDVGLRFLVWAYYYLDVVPTPAISYKAELDIMFAKVG